MTLTTQKADPSTLLTGKFRPGDSFAELLSPVTLIEPDARNRTRMSLPRVGEVQLFVWRGLSFAVASMGAELTASSGELKVASHSFQPITDWVSKIDKSIQPLSLKVERERHSTLAHSQSVKGGSNYRFVASPSFQSERDGRVSLQSIGLNFKVAEGSISLNFDYQARRDQEVTGKIAILNAGRSVACHHFPKALVLELPNNEFRGLVSDSVPSHNTVLARMLGLMETNSPVLGVRESLQGLGFNSEEFLRLAKKLAN